MMNALFAAKRYTGLISALAASVLLASAAIAAETRVLRFATYATERPSEELRKMEPFQKEVEAGLQARGIAARVEVRIFPTYDEGLNALLSGIIDFARLGPVSYVTAKQKKPGLILLASEGHEGRKQFSGVIIVGANSPIRTLADLRGKRFAFGDPNSTTGRYLSQAELVKAGIAARDFSAHDYLGRHDKVVFAVASGGYDAGATNERTFKKYAEEKGLRMLSQFPSPTQAWVARKEVDPATIKALRATLLEMKGAGLEYIDRNGFLPATDSDYDALRKVMKTAQAFGG